MNESILEIAEKIIKNMRTLNRLLFKKEENFSYDGNNVLCNISQETEVEILDLINKIEFNLNKISNSITNEVQIEPFYKIRMYNVIIGIMEQYLFTSRRIQSDNISNKNYVIDLNRIHTALDNFNKVIIRYNSEIANKNNWPQIMLRNEAIFIAKQQINSSISVYLEGTLQELAGRFSDLAHNFLKFIRPLGRLNVSHGIELHEAVRGDGDYEKLKDTLNMLNASIDAFSCNFKILDDNPQNFVNQILKWLLNLIDYHEMIMDFSAEKEKSKDDIELCEKAKLVFQQGMIASKNLYNLLDEYNRSLQPKFNFDLSQWPTKYF